jgi:hypothetical protein
VTIDYDHQRNAHSLKGPEKAIPILLQCAGKPSSIIDFGCGMGTWLRAAMGTGVSDCIGVDGVPIPPDLLLIPEDLFLCRRLDEPIDIGRRFDCALCLEVGEHLHQNAADTLLASLVLHADTIVFSAACPGQRGQHHVNCQWPAWWQSRFNAKGFSCEDQIRRLLWDAQDVEPWYRQNIFIAKRNTASAGREPRLNAAIHPEMLPFVALQELLSSYRHFSQ